MPSSTTVEAIIELLGLLPLPREGGHFRQTYVTGNPEQPETTAIYYLVTSGSFSALHRLDHDELFHFYGGDPCEMVQVDPSGKLSELRLGMDLERGERPQILVPARSWQGTKVCDGGSWCLMGTTMTPGYTQSSFELARQGDLQGFSTAVVSELRRFLAP
ncbi:MAG: cupin domain-containing protein [Thermomicrobiales bacterium]